MQKIWKILKGLFILAVIIFIADFLVVVGVGAYQPEIKKADAIIILGAAINTPALYNRSLQGLKLYQEGKADMLVLSGGKISDADISEAQYMQKVILANGSTTPPMILEQESHSTFENIENSKKLIPNARSVIVVSDTYHLARGVAMAKAAGFDKVYWSSPNSTKYYPTGELLYHYFREAVAMVAYVPKFLVQ
jgi:uncharacterized SAM-binding protein YcdF (DUF218 family)